MIDLNEYLESIIDCTGGMGRFQWILISLVLGSNITIAWSTLMMAFGGATPDWYCEWKGISENSVMINITLLKKCSFSNTSYHMTCVSKQYDPDMSTVVTEWELVCDKDWITSTITTIQMGGLLLGGFISGQVADTFGRRLTYFSALFMLVLFNAIAAFSSSWQMFATMRFFIGVGSGSYLTVYYTFLIEFTPKKYRSMVMAIPVWAIWNVVYGVLCWWLHDWMYVQIATAIASAPWFAGIMFVPESFRWLVSNGKIKEAHDVIQKIAEWNRAEVPDINEFTTTVKTFVAIQNNKKYSVIDVLKSAELIKTTLFLGFCWISCGYGYYAISFGVQQLSGNLYVNLILISAMDIVSVVIWYFTNCIGRKWTTFMFFFIGGIAGIVVGAVQFVEIPDKGNLVNGFALTSKLCVSSGWAALMVFTSESYPTVIRNIGYGINNSITRVGAMVAPQLVLASKHIAGLSYLLFGGLMLMSALCAAVLKETKNVALQDTIEKASVSKKKPDTEDNGTINLAFQKDEMTYM